MFNTNLMGYFLFPMLPWRGQRQFLSSCWPVYHHYQADRPVNTQELKRTSMYVKHTLQCSLQAQTSFVDGVAVGFWAVAPLPGVCPRGGSRLVSSVPLANPTCGSSDGRRSPLARPDTSPTSSWDNSPLALPNTVCETGRVTPRPGGVLSEGKKPLASPTLGASVAGSTLLRPRASSWGCRACPRPKSGTPVIKLSLGGMFGSIWEKINRAETWVNCKWMYSDI